MVTGSGWAPGEAGRRIVRIYRYDAARATAWGGIRYRGSTGRVIYSDAPALSEFRDSRKKPCQKPDIVIVF
jgi:hypothetical protein